MGSFSLMRVLKCFGLTIVFLSFLMTNPLKAASWSTPVELSSDEMNAVGAQVALDAKGGAIALWSEFDGSKYVIQASSCEKIGNWSIPYIISSSDGDAFFPRIAIDSKGNATAIWSVKNGSNSVIQTASKAFKKQWSSAVNISDINSHAEGARIAVNEDGKAYVVWQYYNGFQNVIQFVQKSPKRGDWTSPLTLSVIPSNALGDIEPKIAMIGNGNLLVTWINQDTSSVHAVTKLKDRSWSEPIELSGSLELVKNVQLATDQNGNAIVSWTRKVEDHTVIQANIKSSSGAWSGAVDLSDSDQNSDFSSLTMTPNGSALIAWQQSDGIYSVIKGAKKSLNGHWSLPFDLTLTGQDASQPYVTADSFNTYAVVWKRSDGFNFVIQSSKSLKGNKWSETSTLSLTGEDASTPQLDIDKLGNSVVVWQGSNGLHSIIQTSFKSKAE